MKLKYAKNPKSAACGQTVAVALSLGLLFCLELEHVSAQLKAQKRITWVWTATDAEGSRVTVASDAQLNDYEAYTRGNRFYVKILSADLPTKTGSLLGRGFDDVQIQRVGDGILLSFRLQPGTTARVNQKSNRIEVVFSIPRRAEIAGSSTDQNEPRRNGAKDPETARNKERPGRDERPENSGSVEPTNPSISSAPRLPRGATNGSNASPTPVSAGNPIGDSTPLTPASPASTTSIAIQSSQATPIASPTPASLRGVKGALRGLQGVEASARNNPWLSLIVGLFFMALVLLIILRMRRRRRLPAIPTSMAGLSPTLRAGSAQSRVAIAPEHSGSSLVAGPVATASEDSEREVFEL